MFKALARSSFRDPWCLGSKVHEDHVRTSNFHLMDLTAKPLMASPAANLGGTTRQVICTHPDTHNHPNLSATSRICGLVSSSSDRQKITARFKTVMLHFWVWPTLVWDKNVDILIMMEDIILQPTLPRVWKIPLKIAPAVLLQNWMVGLTEGGEPRPQSTQKPFVC